ncbi:MAG: hypothetical protein L6R39_006480, partial [Caloplaca ligustica]
DLLTGVGKEGLFFRWVEMMSNERTLAGTDFTSESREKAVQRSRELFAEQGLDWDDVIQGVGGLDGLLGMEVTSA